MQAQFGCSESRISVIMKIFLRSRSFHLCSEKQMTKCRNTVCLFRDTIIENRELLILLYITSTIKNCPICSFLIPKSVKVILEFTLDHKEGQ